MDAYFSPFLPYLDKGEDLALYRIEVSPLGIQDSLDLISGILSNRV